MGLPIHHPVDRWLPDADAGAGHRHVRLHVLQHAAEPADSGPLRRPRQLRRSARRPPDVGRALRDAALRRHRAPRRPGPALRPRHAAQQPLRARVALLPDVLLHALHHPVRGRPLRVGQHAQRRGRLAERHPRLVWRRGARLAQRHRLGLSRAGRHWPVGHRQRDDHQHGRAPERPDRAATTPPASTGPAFGASCGT